MAGVTFYPSSISGECEAPPSKSEAARAIALAALGEGECRASGLEGPLCGDILAFVNGARALGATVTRESGALLISPGEARGRAEIDIGSCAAAARMLPPMLASRGIEAGLLMSPALAGRPLDGFCAGFSARLEGRRLMVSGTLRPGEYELGGGISSQYASGMLMALPSARGGKASRLRIAGDIPSRPYVDMTLEMLMRFGIEAREEARGEFAVPPRSAKNSRDIRVNGDWTNGAALICAGLLGGEATITGLDGASAQGDRRVIELLREMGASVEYGNGAVRAAKAGRLRPLDACLSQNPDIAPVMALMCALADGESRLTGLRGLRFKESDRLNGAAEALRALGASASVRGDALYISGARKLAGGAKLSASGDHRMAVMLSLAALACDAPVIVTDMECVSKSWPDFIARYRALGGDAR